MSGWLGSKSARSTGPLLSLSERSDSLRSAAVCANAVSQQAKNMQMMASTAARSAVQVAYAIVKCLFFDLNIEVFRTVPPGGGGNAGVRMLEI